MMPLSNLATVSYLAVSTHELHTKHAATCCAGVLPADNTSGSHTTSSRHGLSSDAAPAQRLLALAWEHAEELFGQRVAADWHNTWQQQGPVPGTFTAAPGMTGGSMFGVHKQRARCVRTTSAMGPVVSKTRPAFRGLIWLQFCVD